MAEQNLSAAAQELLQTIRDGWVPVIHLYKGLYEADRKNFITRFTFGRIISTDAIRVTERGGYIIEREAVQVPTGTVAQIFGKDVPQMTYGNAIYMDCNALWELIEAGLIEEKFNATETVAQSDDYVVFGLVESTEPAVEETAIVAETVAPKIQHDGFDKLRAELAPLIQMSIEFPFSYEAVIKISIPNPVPFHPSIHTRWFMEREYVKKVHISDCKFRVEDGRFDFHWELPSHSQFQGDMKAKAQRLLEEAKQDPVDFFSVDLGWRG